MFNVVNAVGGAGGNITLKADHCNDRYALHPSDADEVLHHLAIEILKGLLVDIKRRPHPNQDITIKMRLDDICTHLEKEVVRLEECLKRFN